MSAKEFVGENGKLKEVVLKDDTRLPADVCIMGVGKYKIFWTLNLFSVF